MLVGLGAMLGAGVFAAFGPAAAAAGAGLVLALGVAAMVAYCNATSSAQLAAVYPLAGGTYVYGRRQLSPTWGFLAGWGFVVGKTASCAAMALTAGAYAWPGHPRVAAVLAAAVLTAVQLPGSEEDRCGDPGAGDGNSAGLGRGGGRLAGWRRNRPGQAVPAHRDQHVWGAAGRWVVVLRLRRLRPNRDPWRRGPGPFPDDPACGAAGVGDRGRGLCAGRDQRAARSRRGRCRGEHRALTGRGAGWFTACARTTGPAGCSRCEPGRAAEPDGGRGPDDVGDGS